MSMPTIFHTSRTLVATAATLIGLAPLIDASGQEDANEDFPLRDAVECHPRAGLANFSAKIATGDTVKIAYLGGSITAAPGWRVKSREWFQEQYPMADFEEIHAAIGGTGSDLGVFRLHNDVLRHQPDLLLVEFAVNDGGASPERIHRAMEGIVRQTWTSDPTIDIAFVYTLAERDLPLLQEGKMQRSASAMEALADHYAIPSIHFGVEVAALEADGELVFKAPKPEGGSSALAAARPVIFSSDGVHPHVETGHQLYVDAIARSWPAITEASGQPGPHSLVAPLRADNWERARQVAISPDMLQGSWQPLDGDHPQAKRFARNMPDLYRATEAGATLTFAFDGSTAAVFDLLGPDGGQLRIQLDEREARPAKRFDGYCTYPRMSKLAIGSDLPPGRHTVTITLTADEFDKRGTLFERNRSDFDKQPEKYADHHWTIGSLLIIGEIIE